MILDAARRGLRRAGAALGARRLPARREPGWRPRSWPSPGPDARERTCANRAAADNMLYGFDYPWWAAWSRTAQAAGQLRARHLRVRVRVQEPRPPAARGAPRRPVRATIPRRGEAPCRLGSTVRLLGVALPRAPDLPGRRRPRRPARTRRRAGRCAGCCTAAASTSGGCCASRSSCCWRTAALPAQRAARALGRRSGTRGGLRAHRPRLAARPPRPAPARAARGRHGLVLCEGDRGARGALERAAGLPLRGARFCAEAACSGHSVTTARCRAPRRRCSSGPCSTRRWEHDRLQDADRHASCCRRARVRAASFAWPSSAGQVGALSAGPAPSAGGPTAAALTPAHGTRGRLRASGAPSASSRAASPWSPRATRAGGRWASP